MVNTITLLVQRTGDPEVLSFNYRAHDAVPRLWRDSVAFGGQKQYDKLIYTIYNNRQSQDASPAAV